MSTYRNRSLQLFSILLVSPGLSGDLYQKELLHRRSFESIAKYDILWPLNHCPTCPTCFKDPRIRIPSFDEAMREILSYREGKATSTRRQKHQKKNGGFECWSFEYFWMCCIVLASGKMWSFKGKKWFASRFASFYHLMPFAQATSAGQNHHWCLEDQLCAIWVQANVIDVIWLFRYSPRWGWRVWLPLGSSRTKPRKLAPRDFELKAEIFFSNPDWKIVHVTLSAVVSLEWKLQR